MKIRTTKIVCGALLPSFIQPNSVTYLFKDFFLDRGFGGGRGARLTKLLSPLIKYISIHIYGSEFFHNLGETEIFSEVTNTKILTSVRRLQKIISLDRILFILSS